MPKHQKLHLLPALIVTAELDGSPVTYIVLSLRLAGIGGDRACRSLLDELRNHDFVRIAKEKDSRDQREKVVRMTSSGWEALEHYAELVTTTTELRRPLLTSVPRTAPERGPFALGDRLTKPVAIE